jgi:hypothetical protein
MRVAMTLPECAAARDVAYGNFMGSGHTCYGMLTITSRGITWVTPGSECRTSPYSVIDRREGPDGLRVTYRLARRSAKCLFSELVLTHRAQEDMDIGWDVVGSPANQAESTLACYLYRR